LHDATGILGRRIALGERGKGFSLRRKRKRKNVTLDGPEKRGEAVRGDISAYCRKGEKGSLFLWKKKREFGRSFIFWNTRA